MAFGIGRRELIAGLGSAALAWPLGARAQQAAIPVVGYLSGMSPDELDRVAHGFRRGLAETGYVEGRNLAIEYRWLEGRYDQIPTMLADLVKRRVAVIAVPNTTTAALAAKAATRTIPIVFAVGSDPVAVGLVVSLNRPGGNLTGVSQQQTTSAAQRLELLHQLKPAERSIAFLVNRTNPSFAEAETREVQSAANVLGVRPCGAECKQHKRDRGCLLHPGPAACWRAPDRRRHFLFKSDGSTRRAGGSSCGSCDATVPRTSRGRRPDELRNATLPNLYRQVGVYAGRILKGEKPADLPVQQPTKFELVINLKTAKALGLDVPPTLLARADEVIE